MAAKYERFPVVLETMRECLQDVYDVGGLRELMGDIAARSVRVVEVETPSASPFARSLLFGYVGMFLYEADAPLAERRAAALSVDSTLLAELLGTEVIKLLDADVVAGMERSLQRLTPERHARGSRRRPTCCVPRRPARQEAAERGSGRNGWSGWWPNGARSWCASPARNHLAIEDAVGCGTRSGWRYRSKCPSHSPSRSPIPWGICCGAMRERIPRSSAHEAATRFGLGTAVVTDVLDRLTAEGALVRELRTGCAGL